PYRLRAGLTFERNINANYFGIGARTMGPLEFDGHTHDTFDEQTRAASALHDGVASPRYNHYRNNKPPGTSTIERIVLQRLAQMDRGADEQNGAMPELDALSKTGTDACDRELPRRNGTPQLGQECGAGVIRGCTGGWNILRKVGVTVDFRDFEPDPNDGVFI